ncbi:MAG: peptide ABC transporter substrate-binding protein [Acidobacteriota bacterium]|nr:peptide ABC transporter substrate-binding protein [Acidobacteriota bacterium]
MALPLYFAAFFVFLSSIFLTGCNELEKPKPEPFYAETAPPQKKEFRWSNGKTPKSFDPALASAAPEIDVVRALFEGLTETDAKTLKTVPAIAAEWSSSEDYKNWTFKLRRDAKWSNGKPVTAGDFASSWKRLAEMQAKIPHPNLLQNIVGMPVAPESAETVVNDPGSLMDQLSSDKTPLLQNPFNSNRTAEKPSASEPENKIIENKITENKAIGNKAGENKAGLENAPKPKTEVQPKIKFGVEAVNDYVLKVSLIESDKDFPSLVAHPIFRPIFGDGKEFETEKLNAEIVTSGAFRIASIGQDGITLDRSALYWNSGAVELERVRFVPTENAETALEAYRAGEIDALTNVNFEPLALKLLEPFKDFRRTTHSALNFYEFNRANAPFSDRRVREALAIAVERERLTEGDMDGATEPALGFLPTANQDVKKLAQDSEKARKLLVEAGFPNGENFPTVQLLVNRNDIQQKIARSVAKMWKRNLNIETQITVKDADELETNWKAGDFDLIRRGVLLPTIDETANMLTIFEPGKKIVSQTENNQTAAENKTTENSNKTAPESVNSNTSEGEKPASENSVTEAFETADGVLFLTEAEAIFELPAIPLYFPTSYSLVKPYIQGFEINRLDAPSLKDVRINNNWQPE